MIFHDSHLLCYGEKRNPPKKSTPGKNILLTINFESSFVVGCNQIQLALSLMGEVLVTHLQLYIHVHTCTYCSNKFVIGMKTNTTNDSKIYDNCKHFYNKLCYQVPVNLLLSVQCALDLLVLQSYLAEQLR